MIKTKKSFLFYFTMILKNEIWQSVDRRLFELIKHG